MRSKDYWRHLFEDAAKENDVYADIWKMLEDLSGKEIADIMLSLSKNSRLRMLKEKPFRTSSPLVFQESQDALLYEIKKDIGRITKSR